MIGNLRASFVSTAIEGRFSGIVTVYSLPQDYNFYKKATLRLQQEENKVFLEGYFDKKIADITLFDKLKIDCDIVEKSRYNNYNSFPQFIKKYESESQIIKIKSVQKLYSNSLIQKLYSLRKTMKELVLNSPINNKFFITELLFGDKLLDYSERKLFVNNGVAHLLSISGLHFAITIIFSLTVIYFLQWLFPKIVYVLPRHKLLIFVFLPLIVFYAFISGLSIPALRAFIVILLFTTFYLLKIAPDPVSLLSLVALTLLLFDPTLLFKKSFQLSFLSVYVLLIFYRHLSSTEFLIKLKTKKIAGYIFDIVLMSLLISIFILPITQNIAPQSLLTSLISNPVAIPLVTFIILPFALISLPLAFISEKLFFFLLSISNFGVNLLLGYLKLLEPIADLSKLYIYFTFSTGIIYLLLVSSLLVIKRWAKLATVSILAILLLFTFQKKFRQPFVTFLDVGQGDCSLIRTEKGRLIFIDTGGNYFDPSLYNSAYKPFLSNLNKSEIEAVILSHYHPDHFGALEELLTSYDVKNVYAPLHYTSTHLIELWKKHDFQLHLVDKQRKWNIDDFSFSLLPYNDDKKENNRSLWCIVNKEGYLFLFTGDTEKFAIKNRLSQAKINSCFLIKVPHHGAKSSFEVELYIRTKPKVAVISVGKRNPWKLPSKEVLQNLKKLGIVVYRTDKNGQVFVFFDKEKPYVKTVD